MSTTDKIRIAVAQTDVTTDPGVNGAAIRAAIRQAADQGARLVHFSEGALSGYAGAAKPYYAGWRINWAPVSEELHRTMALAAEVGVWAVVGGNHRLSGDHRPHNSLWVINDRGEVADRYDKRFVSHAEITDFYSPGDHACTFEVDGFRFGCLVCIEVNFPELWMEQQALGVDCVLFSTVSEDPIFKVIARSHAAVNGFWVSIAVPAQCAPAAASALVGPHGYVLGHGRSNGPDVICIDLDRADPALDIALNKARPWRDTATRRPLRCPSGPRSPQFRSDRYVKNAPGSAPHARRDNRLRVVGVVFGRYGHRGAARMGNGGRRRWRSASVEWTVRSMPGRPVASRPARRS